MTTTDTSRSSRPIARPLALVGLLAAAITAVTLLDVPGPSELRAAVESTGLWGIAIFMAIFIGLALTPVPSSAMAIAAGLLYGLTIGSVVTLVSATVAGTIAYFVGRSLGADALVHYGGSPASRAVRFLQQRGFSTVLAVQVVPVTPFWLVNYAAGVSSVPIASYVLGTAIGILPGMVGFVAIGAFGTSALSWQFVTALVFVFGISVASAVLVQRRAGL
ncbi:TVP38/TMEM64 family protein [Hoyosella sp. G463]|uniref:TVP38/TMEM64 family membrane protein n=1 Tax=Lolliginicoccus lacisalsi TaxID=2742202 RepID=A0A927PKW1_9ACTN|nr:TVP38/TMEM64 family protein [Lolliginicoccus lacisalsi]